MPLARWISLLSTVMLAAAKVQWDAPTSTLPNAGPFGYGVMPRPTAAPAYNNAHALRKRANSEQLCGYISSVSLPEYEITCASSFSCTRHSSLSVLGCCYGQDYCAFDTTCLDSTACDSACQQSTGSLTLVCTNSARPYCASFGENTLSILICSSASTSGLQPFQVQTPTLLSSTTTTTPDPTRPETTDTQTSTSGIISAITNPASFDNPSDGGSTNVGAIAGGVVGGVAVIALGLLGFFLIRRRRKNGDAATTTAAAAATQQQQQQQNQPGVGYYPTDKTGVQQQVPTQMYAGYPPQQPQYAPHDQYAPPQQHMQPQQPPPHLAEMAAYEQRS